MRAAARPRRLVGRGLGRGVQGVDDAFVVAIALLLVEAIRAFGDVDTSNPLTWRCLGGLLGTAGALALLHHRMEPTRRDDLRRSPAGTGGGRGAGQTIEA